MTSTGVSLSFEGAEMMTLVAPPFRWAAAARPSTNTPLDSTTMTRVAPAAAHGILDGSRSEWKAMQWPSTTSVALSASTATAREVSSRGVRATKQAVAPFPSKRPCTESCMNR